MTSNKPFTIGYQYGAGAQAASTPRAPIDADQAFADAQKLIEDGQVDAAEALSRQVVDAQPHHARAWHVLGFCALQKGRPEAALKTLERSAELGNDNPLMFMHLGIARAALKDFAGSAQALERAVEAAPGLAPAQFNLGLSLKRLERLEDAEAAFAKAVEAALDHADAWCELGGVKMALKRDAGETLNAFDRALAADPDHVGALNQKAIALQALNRASEAEALMKRAIALAPKRPELQVNFGDLMLDRDGQAAIDAYRTAAEIAPAFPGAEAKLAAALQRLRRWDEARRHAEAALTRDPASPLAHFTLARCDLHTDNADDALARLDALTAESLGEHDAFVAGKLRAAALERQERFADAFAAAAAANRARLERAPTDAQEAARICDMLDASRTRVTAERVAAWGADGPPAEASPVFFVGFPRSGTTLMEHILKAHPGFVAAGENEWLRACLERLDAPYPDALATLDGTALADQRQAYWDLAHERLGPALAGKRLVDKMPLNILYLGLVRRLFPNAKVLVALRDPRDCVLSGVLQTFQRSALMDQFLSIETTAKFYAAVMDLWAHDRETLGLDALEYRYEDLAADTRDVMEGVLAFLGAPWDDAVLDHARAMSPAETIATPSMHDVREAVHTRAVARWRHYAAELAPVMDTLAPYVRAFGYDEA